MGCRCGFAGGLLGASPERGVCGKMDGVWDRLIIFFVSLGAYLGISRGDL